MGSLVEDVKDKLDVVDFIAGYLKLTPAGSNFRGLCPFHREKSPSFMVSREKQFFHCFGCGKGGDVITFVEEMEGMDFKEALKMLAERAGLDVTKYQGMRSDGFSFDKSNKKETLFRILEASTQFFEQNLLTQEGKSALDYFLSRGLKKATIKEFRLGYSPKNGKIGFGMALFNHLKEMGFQVEEILESGSVFAYQNGNVKSFMDRFKGRAVFPIFDSLGRPVGFSARVLPGETTNQGKYINTPQTLLYDKGSLLYGFHLAKKAVREEGEIVLLEGNLDVVLSHQSGVKQAVATCGTALSKKHLGFIRRYSKKIILAFDADMAGVKATKRGAELGWEEELDVKAISLKVGTDVADIAKENPLAWQKMVARKKSVLGFFFDLAFKKRVLTLDQKKALTDRLIKMIAKVPSEVERSHYLKKIAEEVDVPENFLFEKLKKEEQSLKNDPYAPKSQTEVAATFQKDRRFLLEERILGIIYNFPKLYFKEKERVSNVVFRNTEINVLWDELKKYLAKIEENEEDKVKSSDFVFASRDLKNKVAEIAVRIEKELENIDPEDLNEIKKELKYCLDSLLKENLKEERQTIVNSIKLAQKKGEINDLKELFDKLKEINQKIK